jgi:hypothetical protein
MSFNTEKIVFSSKECIITTAHLYNDQNLAYSTLTIPAGLTASISLRFSLPRTTTAGSTSQLMQFAINYLIDIGELSGVTNTLLQSIYQDSTAVSNNGIALLAASPAFGLVASSNAYRPVVVLSVPTPDAQPDNESVVYIYEMLFTAGANGVTLNLYGVEVEYQVFTTAISGNQIINGNLFVTGSTFLNNGLTVGAGISTFAGSAIMNNITTLNGAVNVTSTFTSSQPLVAPSFAVQNYAVSSAAYNGTNAQTLPSLGLNAAGLVTITAFNIAAGATFTLTLPTTSIARCIVTHQTLYISNTIQTYMSSYTVNAGTSIVIVVQAVGAGTTPNFTLAFTYYSF